MNLAWGAKVSPEFRTLVVQIAAEIGCDPSHLMACIAFESHLDPTARNPVSNATGLIQFMPGTARDLGTTVEALADMTAADQLRYVLAYFRPFAGKLHTFADVYMAILWPAAVGKDDDYVLFAEPTRAYQQNKGLDLNGDGKITKAEAASFPARRLAEGLQVGNVWTDGAAPATAPSEPVSAPIPQPTEATPTRGPLMDPLSLVTLLTSLFAPKIRAMADKALGTDVGKPLVDGLLGAAQQLTGRTDPLEAVAVARQDPKVMAALEAKTEDWFKEVAPAIDKIAALERGEWDAEEGSRTAAAARGMQMQAQGPLKGNPQFLIAIGILSMVGFVVLSVLWKDAVVALFIGKEGLSFGFSTDMQAFVIGAIVGAALTAIIGYFYGSTRASAAKDITIDAIARQSSKK